jgi:predicted nuclease of predicted toxin-antitoxin system
MRLLLDESLPWRLAKLLVGHEVTSVQRMGWTGVKNGALLPMAPTAFYALITADQNLQYQQNLVVLPLAVFMLVARSTALIDLAPLVPVLLKRLQVHEPRTLVRVGG